MTIFRETSEAGRKPALTTANVNQWCKSVLADPNGHPNLGTTG